MPHRQQRLRAGQAIEVQRRAGNIGSAQGRQYRFRAGQAIEVQSRAGNRGSAQGRQ